MLCNGWLLLAHPSEPGLGSQPDACRLQGRFLKIVLPAEEIGTLPGLGVECMAE
jgi:hypothetical protein